MASRAPGVDGRNIVVADEDRAVVGLVIETLLKDGHAVERLPELAILYLANRGRSTPELERQLPDDVPILREPRSCQVAFWRRCRRCSIGGEAGQRDAS